MVRRAPGISEARVYDVSDRRVRGGTHQDLHQNLQLTTRNTSNETLKRARRKVEINDMGMNLIQDFEFPTVSTRIKLSGDGQYLYASGTYAPQIHVYDAHQLSLKFKRHVDSEIVDFQILEEDYRKFVLLRQDRYLDFHSAFGSHFKTRLPKYCRDLMVNKYTSDLFACGQGSDVYVYNLQLGCFKHPLNVVDSGDENGINCCAIHPVHNLLAFGNASHTLNIFDSRTINSQYNPITHLTLPLDNIEITNIRFNQFNSLQMAVGTTNGYTLIYDLRKEQPITIKNQGNNLPIKSIRFQNDNEHVLSADTKSMKIWSMTNVKNKNLAVIEPEHDINHVCQIEQSGVLCVANESPKVKSFYIPMLGNAPKWCSFLDTFTEELENGKNEVEFSADKDNQENNEEDEIYENYKFITKDDIIKYKLSHLLGSNILKAYMHGYFIHNTLYKRMIEIAKPFAYDDYKKQKAKDKIDQQRQSRITKIKNNSQKKKRVAVNQVVLDLEQAKNNGKSNVQGDDRFTAMFQNKDFQVDEDAERFQFLHPGHSMAHNKNKRRGFTSKEDDEDNSDTEYLEQFQLVDDDNGKNDNDGQLWSSDDDDDDDENENDGDESDEEEEEEKDDDDRIAPIKEKSKVPKMYEIEKDSEGMMVATSASKEKSGDEFKAGGSDVKTNVALGDRMAMKRQQQQQRQRGRFSNRGRRNRR